MDDWRSNFKSWMYDMLVWTLIDSNRSLNRYLDLMGTSLRDVEEFDLEPLSDDEAQGISDYHRKVINEHFSDNSSDKYKFPEEFYKSFVIALFSKIEKELLEFCGRAYLGLKLVVSPDDKESIGTGIFRAYKFLAQEASYSINNQLWRELQIIGKVRNQIVHSVLPYIAPVLKPDTTPIVKIHVENGDHIQDYYLQMDTEFHKHLSKYNILKYGGASVAPENQFAFFEITPDYEYCQYLIDFRKRLFLRIYNDLLDISSQT